MPIPRREGELIIDHTFSPGITPEQMIAAGLPPELAVGKDRKMECATVTCLHCNVVVVLNPKRTRPRGYCAKCDGYVCDRPGCGLECRPFAKLLDTVQANAERIDAGLAVSPPVLLVPISL